MIKNFIGFMGFGEDGKGWKCAHQATLLQGSGSGLRAPVGDVMTQPWMGSLSAAENLSQLM